MSNGGNSETGGQPALQQEEWLPVATDVAEDKGETELREVQQRDLHEVLALPGAKSRLALRTELFIAPLRDGFARAIGVERSRGTAFLWVPVCFGTGSLLYFALPREPLSGAFAVLAVVLALLVWPIGKQNPTWVVFAGLALVAAGSAAAQWRTQVVNTNMMSRNVVAQVSGQVERVEVRANGRVRYTIDTSPGVGDVTFRGGGLRPHRVRLTAREKEATAEVGERIIGRARLGPPPGPAFPGAYDFSFQAWFEGIGASGFFLGKPRREKAPVADGLSSAITLSKIRSDISKLIRRTVPGRDGALAAALIVGDRSGIDEETAEALRKSGLAHILAISGLHMALVSATVIASMRFLMALFPQIPLQYPTRKWAAGIALVAAAGYLLLSGASVSTQRAFVMIAIMLVAVQIDRRALTMRNVALAAIVVLIITPESVLSPGFQMSFAAVAALVATYTALTERQRKRAKQPPANPIKRVALKTGRNVGGLALTSLIAGLATGLFAAYHFYRVAPFGLLANLLAMPVVSLLVMPLALLSMIAMPFGLESVPLNLMGMAIAQVVAVADWVASLDAAGNTGFISPLTVSLGALALSTVTLLQSRLRLLAVPLAILAVLPLGRS